MTPKELDQVVQRQIGECELLLTTKGKDYAGGGDRLANFKQAAAKRGITVFQAWGVYFDKHLAAIDAYTREGQVESEPITGRITDAINYLLLLRALIEEKGEEGKWDAGERTNAAK